MDTFTSEICANVIRIGSGNFFENDLLALFIQLRDKKKLDPLLKEITHFFAHPRFRDSGSTLDTVSKYIANLVNVARNGGTITPKPLCTKEQLFNTLLSEIQKLPIDTKQKKSFFNQKNVIIEMIMKMLDGKKISFKKDNEILGIDKKIIYQCYLKYDNNQLNFCLNMDLNEKFIKNVSRKMTWCVSLII